MSNAQTQLQSIKPFLNLDEADGCYWQAVMNVGYSWWQDNANEQVNTYTEMVDLLEKEFGPLAKLAVLIGKYNQQVCNGGHMQYFDNGYASTDTAGCFSSKNDIQHHIELTELVKSHLSQVPLVDKLLPILKQFDADMVKNECEECGGSGVCDYDDETEMCEYCCGSGESENETFQLFCDSNELDALYYKINEDIEKNVTEFYASILK